MKVISIWQPWASLVVHGMKFFETRSWPAPKSLIGQTIGIAATKNITPPQRDAYVEPEFSRFYEMSGLPPLEELPRGMLLGTVTLDSVELVTEDFIEDITLEEQAFGWYALGGYAWRLKHAKPLARPISVSGKQGIWDFREFPRLAVQNEHPHPTAQDQSEAEAAWLQGRAGEEGSGDLGSYLQAV